MEQNLKEILAKAYSDTAFAGKLLFPERFFRDFTSLHQQIFDIVDKRPGDPGYKPKKMIIVPRGLGKTSISNLLIPAKKALFQEARYIVPVSASATLAEQQSENLKMKLLNNPKIKKMYGDLKTNRINKQQWVINVGGSEEAEGHKVCIMPRGAGQQIRGLLYDDYRPDLFIVDDLEDPDNLDSEEQRAKKKKWFHSDLLQAVDNYAPLGSWEVVMVGTVLHQDSLLNNLRHSDDWDVIELAICDENLKSNIPEWVSDEWVLEKYNEMKDAGEVDSFYREYMNRASAGGKDSAFQAEYFQYYNPRKRPLKNSADLENIILVDPARTAKMTSADSAIVGLAIDLSSNTIYVRDIISAKLHQDQLYDEIFKMANRIGARALGIEVTGLHEFITYPIKNEMARRGVTMDFIELHARGGKNEKGKVQRVSKLIPFYRQGLIYHNASCCHALEAQLMSFPRAKNWDIMDALSYAIELLEKGERYMYHKLYNGYGAYEDIESEYDEVSENEAPLQNFRALDFESFR
jgi:predicted phage terminase large subunit-like protein